MRRMRTSDSDPIPGLAEASFHILLALGDGPSHGYAKPRHGRHHHKHHRFFAFAPYGYDYGYGYGDGCYWLKNRAIYTGSDYWWNRYYNCLNGYGYE